MGKYFGTDGIRGIYEEFLTDRLAFMTANALTAKMTNKVIVLGRDTRISGERLSTNIIEGALLGGASVINLGIIPTPAVAYITQLFNADYGIVISASHNPPEYNGLKIFNNKGVKLTRAEENDIEKHLEKDNPFIKKGKKSIVISNRQVYALYEKALMESIEGDLTGLKIVLDCSNGACGEVATNVFRGLGADVIIYNSANDGAIINYNCGALYPEFVAEKVLAHRADIGFAFDGDADRIIASDNLGRIIDGDDIIYLLGRDLQDRGLLNPHCVVGTLHTNMGVEQALKSKGIDLIRTDIGDHNVVQAMLKDGQLVGGEQSGHIINRLFSNTGDGVLTAILLSDMVKRNGSKMSELEYPSHYPQCNLAVKTTNKDIINTDKDIIELTKSIETQLIGVGRLLLRASGTEPKIRIMIEHNDEKKGKELAHQLESLILSKVE